MPKTKPTTKNIFIFSLVYQLYPLILYFLARLANPDPKLWAVIAIFGIAQFVLILMILSWRRKADIEVVDEREVGIQLRVKSSMLNATYIAIGITLLVNATLYKEMPGWVALCLIIPPGVITEAIANWHYRKL